MSGVDAFMCRDIADRVSTPRRVLVPSPAWGVIRVTSFLDAPIVEQTMSANVSQTQASFHSTLVALFIPDFCFAYFSSPPQTEVVRVAKFRFRGSRLSGAAIHSARHDVAVYRPIC